MEKFIIDFVVNGLAGPGGDLLTLGIRRIWLSIIVPWYEERVYHDAHFEGRWNGTESFPDTDPPLVDGFTMGSVGRVTASSHTTCLEGPDAEGLRSSGSSRI